jgi:hypothetical protein
MREGTVI